MGFNGLPGTPVSTGTKTMVLKPYGKAQKSYIRDGCNWGKQRHGLWKIIWYYLGTWDCGKLFDIIWVPGLIRRLSFVLPCDFSILNSQKTSTNSPRNMSWGWSAAVDVLPSPTAKSLLSKHVLWNIISIFPEVAIDYLKITTYSKKLNSWILLWRPYYFFGWFTYQALTPIVPKESAGWQASAKARIFKRKTGLEILGGVSPRGVP